MGILVNQVSNWRDVMLNYYQILQIAVAVAKGFSKAKKALQKENSVKEIRENLLSGELHFGDTTKIIGTFSEYLPFIDPKFFLTDTEIQSSLPRTARLQAIDDVYCGALFKPEQRNAFGDEVVPIFYGIDSEVLEHYTGEMLELQCQIIQVPSQYRDIINQNSYFTFKKEEGLQIPFGLKILNVKPYGLVDTFRINSWLIGNLNPAPYLKKTKKYCCGNCYNFFSYMQIDPFKSLLKYGCAKYSHAPEEMSKELNEESREFFEMERNNKPYLVFPKLFHQFEIFYPSVDIFDEKQKDRSKNILLGVINENMERLFRIPANLHGIIRPKESALSVDFQYDQLRPITSQTFDPSNVPKWECPHYVPDPEKIKKLKTDDEKITKNGFKLKKAF